MRDKRDKRTNKHGSEIVRRRRREMRVEDRQHVYEGMPDNTHHDAQSVHQLAHHSITALGLPPRSPSVADSSLLAAGVLPVAPQDPQLHPSQPPFCVRIESGWGRRDGPRAGGGEMAYCLSWQTWPSLTETPPRRTNIRVFWPAGREKSNGSPTVRSIISHTSIGVKVDAGPAVPLSTQRA